MKIAVITDTHFGARNDNAILAKQYEKFYANTFFPALDEHDVKTVLHLGDLTDRRKYINFVTAKFLEESLIAPLSERGIETHIILGNHDTYYKNTNEVNSLRQLYGNTTHTNLHFYEHGPVELTFDSLKIMLSPWVCASNYADSVKAYQDTDAQVLMGHFEIQGFEMMRGQLCDHGFDKKIFNKFDSVYSGHFHHPSTHDNITYLGAPYEMNWSDYDGRRGFHILDTETREMEFIENPYKVFHKISYDDADMTVEDVAHLDTSLLTDTFLKVIVKSKNNPYIYDLFLDRLQQSGAADIKVVEDHMNLDSIDDSELVDEAQDTLTIIGKYIDSVETNVSKDRVTRLVQELYTEAMNQ